MTSVVDACVLCWQLRVVQDLTFDCRWWGDVHHGNSAVQHYFALTQHARLGDVLSNVLGWKACHEGLNLYSIAIAVFLFSQVSSLLTVTTAGEEYFNALVKAIKSARSPKRPKGADI